jgi:hypothetical protein
VFRLTRSVLSVLLLAGGLVAVTGTAPAAAAPPFGRYRAESAYGPKATKQVTASCPDGQTVVGAGGHLTGDTYGAVVLTAVLPKSDGVTAIAAALPGQDAVNWSVVAVAVCTPAGSAAAAGPVRPTITTGSFTASCPRTSPDLVSGTGFALPGSPGQALLTGLVPSPDLKSVTATAVLLAPGLTAPTAYAICVPPGTNPHRRDGSSGPKDTTAPKTATASGEAYGAGAEVTAGVSDVFIDGMVPDPGLLSATAHASELVGGTDPTPWQLTAYGTDAYSYY